MEPGYNEAIIENKQKYWYKRRRYGWGWTPITWQGWLAILGFLVGVWLAKLLLLGDVSRDTWAANGGIFLGVSIILVLLLLISSYARGPKPKWRWGSKPSDNPDEDL